MHFPLSIIIPTHKRRDTLRQCLECISKQTLLRATRFDTVAPRRAESFGKAQDKLRRSRVVPPAQRDVFEVIVVSDGPDEKTAEMIQSLSWPFEIQHFAIPKSQQGVARNRAAEKARGKISLLIGDDIFLAEDACEKHLRASDFPLAVLGYTTWDPTLKITPLMRWMEEGGVQFGYPKIAEFAHAFLPEDRQHFFTYTSNLSIPTKLLWKYPFREDVSLYGWEDVEWGRRLADEGIQLFYEPDARGYHHHLFTDADVWERSMKLGMSAVEMERASTSMAQSPLQLVPRGFKRLAYHLCALLPTYRGKHCRAFLKGMRQAR